MELYGKLWQVGSVEAFMDVWVHCLECHHYSYFTGRVLHRDVSENNLMFKIGNDDQVKGILIDWDMTSWVDETGEIPLSTAQHRTGTLPFTAIDLLAEKPPPHLYRHDLESFFYILIWAALHYNFENKARASEVHPAVESWNSSIMEFGRSKKKNVVSSGDESEIEAIISQIPPQYQDLGLWIRAIWDLFDEANLSHRLYRSKKRAGADASWDDKTNGGYITFEKYMQAIGRTIRPEI